MDGRVSVAACCDVLQCVAVRCSALQCAAVCCSVLQCPLQCVTVCCSALQCVGVLQCISACCGVLLVHIIMGWQHSFIHIYKSTSHVSKKITGLNLAPKGLFLLKVG